MSISPMQTFQAFGDGMMSGTESWKDVLAENVTFTGPVDQVQGKEAFVKLTEGFMAMIRGNRMKNVVEAGNFVITQIEMDVVMPSGKTITLDMSEWYEIRNGKIQSVKVYYDADEFREELGT